MHFTQAPRIGDKVSGTVVGFVGAHTSLDEDGNEVTRARLEVELDEALDTVQDHPQEPAGGVEPHAGEPEPKVTSNDNPNRDADIARLKKESSAAAAKVKEQQTHADQNEVNEAGDKAAKSAEAKAAEGNKPDGSPKTTSDKK